MINIAIIGAGQIGSRHLQALAGLNCSARIQIVDPAEESLRVSKERFYEVYDGDDGKITLECLNTIDSLYDSIDLAIISTSSNVRAQIIKAIIQKKIVKNLILEKVLFQKIDEYYLVDNLLKENHILAWVNCWMRATEFYKKIKAQLDPDEIVQMRGDGSLWGMGCNSIHFIDLFSFLTGNKYIEIFDCHLDESILESQRSGFREFTGYLKCRNSNGHSLTLNCHDKGNEPFRIQLTNGSQKHEITGFYDVIHKFTDGVNELVEKVSVPVQSQTTHLLVHQIINEKCCDLPKYRDSMKIHIPFIEIMIRQLRKITGEEIESCPVT